MMMIVAVVAVDSRVPCTRSCTCSTHGSMTH